MPIPWGMKWNVSVLLLCVVTLSACALDLSIKEGQDSGSLLPESGSEQILSVDFRAKSDNTEITDFYISSDKSQYDFVTSIAGYLDRFAPDPDHPGSGFVMVVKNASSPVSWADKALWGVSSKAEDVQHFADLPPGLEFCDLFPHGSVINMHCFDSDFEPVSYQISRTDKTTATLLAKLGYAEDATHRHEIRPISSEGVALDLVEVRKVAKADASDSKLVDLYIFKENSYRKISISPADLSAIEQASIGGASVRMPSVVTFTSFQSSSQQRNLLIVDLSNAASLSLTRIFVGTDWFSIRGLMNGALILDVNNTLKAFRMGSGLSDLSFSSDNYSGIAGERVYFNSPWVFGQPQSFNACDIDGTCQTVISDLSGYNVLSSVHEGQKKIYFVNDNLPEANRVIESIDVVSHVLSVESGLVAALAGQGIPVSKVNGVEREGDHLVVYYQNPDTGKSSLAIFDGTSEAFQDSFVRYCSGTVEEQAEFILKNHKYLTPMEPGLNLLNRGFGCM